MNQRLKYLVVSLACLLGLVLLGVVIFLRHHPALQDVSCEPGQYVAVLVAPEHRDGVEERFRERAYAVRLVREEETELQYKFFVDGFAFDDMLSDIREWPGVADVTVSNAACAF